MSMMQRRLIALGVVLLLGGAGVAVLSWQQRRSESAAQGETAAAKILDLEDPKTVTRLQLRSAKGEVVVERRGDAWQVSQPLSTAADATTVDGILGSLAGLESVREVGETQADGGLQPPDDLKLFGLEPARITLVVSLDDGSTESLLIGKKSSFDGTLFVKRADSPSVHQVAAAIEYQVDKSPFDVREKRLAVFEPDALRQLTVSFDSGREGYTVARSDSGFQITAPVQTPADRDQISGILSALGEVRASRFVDEAPDAAALEKYALAPPAVRAVLDFGEARQPVVMLFGSVPQGDDDPAHYATRDGEAPIVELSSDWAVRKLLAGIGDLRDKHVLPFERDAVAGVTLVHGESKLRFEMRADEAKGRGTWFMLEPRQAKAQDATMTGLLYTLWSLKARDIVSEPADATAYAEYGLSSPDISITLSGSDGVELGTLRISGDQAGTRFASGSGTGRVDLIDAETVDELGLEAEAYLPLDDSDG